MAHWCYRYRFLAKSMNTHRKTCQVFVTFTSQPSLNLNLFILWSLPESNGTTMEIVTNLMYKYCYLIEDTLEHFLCHCLLVMLENEFSWRKCPGPKYLFNEDIILKIHGNDGSIQDWSINLMVHSSWWSPYESFKFLNILINWTL